MQINIMKLKLLFFSFFILSATFVFSQSYNTAAGLRFGTDWGITVKQRIAKKITLEGILQASNKRDLNALAVLLEFHAPILTKRFNLYAGAGIQKGWYTSDAILLDDPFGLVLIGGGEFSLGRLNLSYDVKPVINISGGEKSIELETAVSVRYIIVKKKWKPFKKRKKSKKKNKDWWKIWEKS